jgi:hypothetical protein
MKFPSLSSAKNTLTTAVKKPSLATIAPVVAGALMLTPAGLAVGGAKMAIEHKDAIKTTLRSAAHEIKKDVKVVVSTVEKGAVTGAKVVGKGVKSVGSGLTNMLYIGAGVGGLVVLMMILK